MGSCLGRRSDFSSELLGEDYEHHEPPPPYEERVPFIPVSSSPFEAASPSQQQQQQQHHHHHQQQQQSSDAQQSKLMQRLAMIDHLPIGTYEGHKSEKLNECAICMNEFVVGVPIRYLPCMHTYHVECIDGWLVRSFHCPSCMEPIDVALFSSYVNGVDIDAAFGGEEK